MSRAIYAIVGLVLGILIGYIGHSFIQPYATPMQGFTTLLVLTGPDTSNLNNTVYIIATLNISSATLGAVLEYIKPYLLPTVTTQLLTLTNFGWSIIGETRCSSTGEATFPLIFKQTGTFQLKARFTGSEILKPSESAIFSITIT